MLYSYVNLLSHHSVQGLVNLTREFICEGSKTTHNFTEFLTKLVHIVKYTFSVSSEDYLYQFISAALVQTRTNST